MTFAVVRDSKLFGFLFVVFFFFFFKQKTAYEIVSRDWSSDVCSSDLFLKRERVELSVPNQKTIGTTHS